MACRLCETFEAYLSVYSVTGMQSMETSHQELLAAATCICPTASAMLSWTPSSMDWHVGALADVMRLLAFADGPHSALLLFRCGLLSQSALQLW